MERKNIDFPDKLNHQQVRSILSHRYPFLLVDKILKIEENRILGLKNISATDPHLVGHFPEQPIFPGVLLIESCAQVAGILVSKMAEGRGYLARVKDFKFTGFIEPGDTVLIEGNFMSKLSSFIQINATAKVGDKVVGKGEIIYSFL